LWRKRAWRRASIWFYGRAGGSGKANTGFPCCWIYKKVYTGAVSIWKPVAWMGDSLAKLRSLPAELRSEVGYQLERVQSGRQPSDFRPMPDVGSGVVEIRLHGETEHRVFYVARFPEAVYVLHCFEKKTQATRKADIELGRHRYAEVLALRSGMKQE
jgi:phage-related protein